MKARISKFCIGVAASSLLISAAANAQQSPFSYNYIEGNASQGEIQGFDYTSYGAELSLSFTDRLFIKATAQEGESDDRIFIGPFSGRADIRAYSVGLGHHMPISSRTDFVTEVSYIKNELRFRNFESDVEGYGINLGIRSMLSDNFELEAGANYVDGSDIDGEFGFSADARLYFSSRLSLSAGYAKRDDIDGITVGLRFGF